MPIIRDLIRIGIELDVELAARVYAALRIRPHDAQGAVVEWPEILATIRRARPGVDVSGNLITGP